MNYPNNRKLLASDDDVESAVLPPGSPPQTAIPFALTKAARKRGAQSLEWLYNEFDNAKLHDQLTNLIYDGQSLWDLSRRAVFWLLGSCCCCLGQWPRTVRRCASFRRAESAKDRSE